MLPPDSDWNRIGAQLARVTPSLETSETLPPACYTDAAVLAREHERIFRTCWVGIGRADRWQTTGDYVALNVGCVPIIVVRDKHGGLRAFANSCRHRGTQLLVGAGNCRRIQCPFHSWTYALDGRLIGAPRMDRAVGFEMADYGLVAFRAAVVDGFAFVCLDPATADLDDWLGDFSDRHAPWGLDGLVATRRREFDIACNWKMVLEVFNEYYHLPYVHADSFGDIYQEPDAPDAVAENYATQFGATQGTGRSDPRRPGPRAAADRRPRGPQPPGHALQLDVPDHDLRGGLGGDLGLRGPSRRARPHAGGVDRVLPGRDRGARRLRGPRRALL